MTTHTPSHSGRSTGFRWWIHGGIVFAVVAILVFAAAIISAAGSSRTEDLFPTATITRSDLFVTVTEQGTLESSNNTEIKCMVRGDNTIIWVIENGTQVQPGDELLRLDTLHIEEQISERTKYAHLARSTAARSKADVARAELAISEYLEGRYVSTLASLQKDLAIAESRLVSAQNMLDHAQMMSQSGYVSELEVEQKQFAVSQADLNVGLTKTQIEVLKKFTKEEELATLRGNLDAAKARYEADKERAYADEQRLLRAQHEFEQCVVKAEVSGIVIYPTGDAWEESPDIEEGATVHKNQVLLLMPDLTRMQVKVGVHESIVDRVQPGMPARVTLSGRTLSASVSSVAQVAKPAGWWTGNVVKYDTIVELPAVEGLKPGMSVEVDVIMAQHENVLTVPAAAVIETSSGHACWVQVAGSAHRRELKLGDHSEMSIVVQEGLHEGEKVVVNPLAHIPEAQDEAARTIDKTTNDDQESQS